MLLAIACFALLGAFAFVVAAFVSSLGTFPIGIWSELLPLAALFAFFGAIYGTILALDRSSGGVPYGRRFFRVFDAPILRTGICATLGAGAALLVWSWGQGAHPVSWGFMGAVAGAVLGWFGWRLARYVEF